MCIFIDKAVGSSIDREGLSHFAHQSEILYKKAESLWRNAFWFDSFRRFFDKGIGIEGAMENMGMTVFLRLLKQRRISLKR